MVLPVATQLQLQSVAVYCISLDSFSLKKSICIQHIYLKFEKHTKMLLFLLLLLALTSRKTARLSPNKHPHRWRFKLQFPIEPTPQSVREIGGSTGGASGVASNFPGAAMAPPGSPRPWGYHWRKVRKNSEHKVKMFQGNKIILLRKLYIQSTHFKMCLFQLQNYIKHDTWHFSTKDLITSACNRNYINTTHNLALRAKKTIESSQVFMCFSFSFFFSFFWENS